MNLETRCIATIVLILRVHLIAVPINKMLPGHYGVNLVKTLTIESHLNKYDIGLFLQKSMISCYRAAREATAGISCK